MASAIDWADIGIQGVLRIGRTVSVLGRKGVSWLTGHRPPPPRLARELFEELGTTYIKLGQFVASSPSLFPEDYVNEFQHCLDNTPRMPFSYVKSVLEQELGGPLSRHFEYIEKTPLASASIAQVHAARTVDGKDVVLKVQRPGVDKIINTDFNFLFLAATVIERIAPGLSRTAVSGIIEEIHQAMMEECDFEKEAHNLEVFNEFLLRTGNDFAVAPKPYRNLTTRRVLTMERFYGVPLTDLESIREYSNDPAETLVMALNTWFASLMACEFFHADVHAGNLMVLKDGRIGFIDFGIVGRIDPKIWHGVIQFFEAIAHQNYDEMAESMATIGMTKDKVDTQALSKDLQNVYLSVQMLDPAVVADANENSQEINRLLNSLVKTAEKHGIRFPRAFALLVKQFLYFDRYVQILAPEMNMFDDERVTLMGDFDLLAEDAGADVINLQEAIALLQKES